MVALSPSSASDLSPRWRVITFAGMHAFDLAPYCIHATDPGSALQVEYECVGFELAHEKAVDLRIAGFKNVVLSLAGAPDSSETLSKDMTVDSETASFYVRGTDPRNGDRITYECAGFAMAHGKATELRMGGYRDVVMSMNANDNRTAE